MVGLSAIAARVGGAGLPWQSDRHCRNVIRSSPVSDERIEVVEYHAKSRARRRPLATDAETQSMFEVLSLTIGLLGEAIAVAEKLVTWRHAEFRRAGPVRSVDSQEGSLVRDFTEAGVRIVQQRWTRCVGK